MTVRTPGDRTDLAKVVERQMRNWELARQQRPAPQPDHPEAPVAPYVAVSRAIASGGSAVATHLGETLGWPVFDREILQEMAGDNELRRRLYEELDERDVGWLEDALRWVMHGEFRRDDYFYKLGETILALARQGPAVFLGRAADLILPPAQGLSVRVDADKDQRAKELARRHGVSEALALAEVERVDRERAEFRKRHFGAQSNQAAHFDLTLSLSRFDAEQAVAVITAALRVRGLIAAST